MSRAVVLGAVDECNLAELNENEFKQQTESKMNAISGN
jgi:hypothetical protein